MKIDYNTLLIDNCSKCDLSLRRLNICNGRGNQKSKIMIIGEAPGALEDKHGIPFVGTSGQLLRKMLRLLNIEPKELYITNAIKCRPPNNRTPNQIELDNCKENLLVEIIKVNPKVIVLLGSTAYRAFYPNANTSISNERGVLRVANGRIILPMYHPSYLLRNPTHPELWLNFWKDLVLLYKISIRL